MGIRQREGKQYRDSYLLESYQMKGGTGKKLIVGSFEERRVITRIDPKQPPQPCYIGTIIDVLSNKK